MAEVVQISSKDNRRLVELRKLRDGLGGERVFLEGRRLVREALRSKIELDELYFAESFADRSLLDQLIGRVSFAAELPERTFNSLAETNTPQGIIVTARRPVYTLTHLSGRLSGGSLPLILLLEGVNNPSNLGAVVRSAEAADAAGVIVARGSADAFSPKSLRAAMGSSLRLPVITGVTISDVAAWARQISVTIVATEAAAEADHTEYDWKSPAILVFGSEAHGVTAAAKAYADRSVRIPMSNGVESLNLAVSAGIILFEARRQNG